MEVDILLKPILFFFSKAVPPFKEKDKGTFKKIAGELKRWELKMQGKIYDSGYYLTAEHIFDFYISFI